MAPQALEAVESAVEDCRGIVVTKFLVAIILSFLILMLSI